MTTIERNIGQNRGKSRLWIEGKALASEQWSKGKRFDMIFGLVSYRGEMVEGMVYLASVDGKRKVAGTSDRPIIDTNTDKLGIFAPRVVVNITSECITIVKA